MFERDVCKVFLNSSLVPKLGVAEPGRIQSEDCKPILGTPLNQGEADSILGVTPETDVNQSEGGIEICSHGREASKPYVLGYTFGIVCL